MVFEHQSVLLQETIEMLFTDPDGLYVDCTLGGAGHSALLLQRLSASGRLVCFDQDEIAVANARMKFANDPRVTVFQKNFVELEDTIRTNSLLPAAGIMYDLGVSSPQLDEAERGFSYMQDATLDMRMDRRKPLTAEEIVNSWSVEDLTGIIRDYGEEKWALRIAKFIGEARIHDRIRTTGQLVEIIKNAVPAAARREGPHPAKRTFQALRIAVNKELEVLEETLDQALRCLQDGGRIAVITFHSLEDRIVKNKFQSWMGKCTCPPSLPVCCCGAKPLARLVNKKPIVPSREEENDNPRSRSAKLRTAEKLKV
ncbi:MAG: 16S rRNA (cytosine(1402)-N(4))-methyltransferase RsmH [Dehalobacter sp. 4CP]|uniref:16S rRNA (cytosine(1402)-N(4))-methyltransferase RsmH n=1 Tax=Dehalobacter sp. CP TaxID=2594474 RepID=UPI0013C994E3|nr:16S rRNA (cytosine(1402)-N(4))-methyltransferase RsmH [Dehalobacter sp. 4CP]